MAQNEEVNDQLDKEFESKPKQEKRWAKQYRDVVNQGNTYLVPAPAVMDNSSLAQPPAYDEVFTVFSTSAGDQPITIE